MKSKKLMLLLASLMIAACKNDSSKNSFDYQGIKGEYNLISALLDNEDI
jgi:uncharacterized lipoprotein YajG